LYIEIATIFQRGPQVEIAVLDRLSEKYSPESIQGAFLRFKKKDLW
jgi:hypothetical protein